jgi:hypothetical protein
MHVLNFPEHDARLVLYSGERRQARHRVLIAVPST